MADLGSGSGPAFEYLQKIFIECLLCVRHRCQYISCYIGEEKGENLSLKELTLSWDEGNNRKEKIKKKIVKYIRYTGGIKCREGERMLQDGVIILNRGVREGFIEK